MLEVVTGDLSKRKVWVIERIVVPSTGIGRFRRGGGWREGNEYNELFRVQVMTVTHIGCVTTGMTFNISMC